jgi:hypothetical protein
MRIDSAGTKLEWTMRILCPRQLREVDCTLVVEHGGADWQRVARCSGLADTHPAATCDERCVEMLNRGGSLGCDGDG